MTMDTIALFELGESAGAVGIVVEKHSKLVEHDEISKEDLESYQRQSD